MPAKGLSALCGFEEMCPESTSPTLGPMETQNSSPDFCSVQGPLLKVFGSNFLASCLCPTHINPGIESNVFFIVYNQCVKILHPAHVQVCKLHWDAPGRFMLAPSSHLCSSSPHSLSPRTQLQTLSIYRTQKLPLSLEPVGQSRHPFPSSH